MGVPVMGERRLGLGLAALGRPAYITAGRDIDLGTRRDRDSMERRAHEVLNAAFDAGVRYFDVARSYGLAEVFLADWVKARDLAPGAVSFPAGPNSSHGYPPRPRCTPQRWHQRAIWRPSPCGHRSRTHR